MLISINQIKLNAFLSQGKLYNNLVNNEEDFEVLYYMENDKVENVEDFINLINVSSYWMIDYDFSKKEDFIKDNIVFLIYNLVNLSYIPENLLLLCLKYCKCEDFPAFYNFYHIEHYLLIDYIRKNENDIDNDNVKKEDYILARHINLYINLLNDFFAEYYDDDIKCKYSIFNEDDDDEKMTKIILGYLVTLINYFDMNYKIIVDQSIYTLFTYFIEVLKYSNRDIDQDPIEERTNLDIIIVDNYIEDAVIEYDDIYISDLFYFFKDKISNNDVDIILFSFKDDGYDRNNNIYFLDFLTKDNNIKTYLNVKYDWDNVEELSIDDYEGNITDEIYLGLLKKDLMEM